MSFSSFIEWAFLGITSGGVWILWLMRQSVNDLNVKIAVLISRHERVESDVKEHSARIGRVETFLADKTMCFDHATRISILEEQN